MIEFIHRKDIFKTEADFVVVPVNCVGRPGKGLAKQWSDNAPDSSLHYYIRACGSGDLLPGHILYFVDSTYILAATKDHWMKPSQYEWILEIATALSTLSISNKWWSHDADRNIIPKVIAVPKLGCGLGGLDWRIVKDIFIQEWTQLPTKFLIYE